MVKLFACPYMIINFLIVILVIKTMKFSVVATHSLNWNSGDQCYTNGHEKRWCRNKLTVKYTESENASRFCTIEEKAKLVTVMDNNTIGVPLKSYSVIKPDEETFFIRMRQSHMYAKDEEAREKNTFVENQWKRRSLCAAFEVAEVRHPHKHGASDKFHALKRGVKQSKALKARSRKETLVEFEKNLCFNIVDETSNYTPSLHNRVKRTLNADTFLQPESDTNSSPRAVKTKSIIMPLRMDTYNITQVATASLTRREKEKVSKLRKIIPSRVSKISSAASQQRKRVKKKHYKNGARRKKRRNNKSRNLLSNNIPASQNKRSGRHLIESNIDVKSNVKVPETSMLVEQTEEAIEYPVKNILHRNAEAPNFNFRAIQSIKNHKNDNSLYPSRLIELHSKNPTRSKRNKNSIVKRHDQDNSFNELQYNENASVSNKLNIPYSSEEKLDNTNKKEVLYKQAIDTADEVKELAQKLVAKVGELQNYLHIDTKVTEAVKNTEIPAIDDLCSNFTISYVPKRKVRKTEQHCVTSRRNKLAARSNVIRRGKDKVKRESVKQSKKYTQSALLTNRKRGLRKRSNQHKWDRWTDWSSCSVTCGKGRQIRWRYCLHECTTAETEMEEKACQLPACPPGKFLGIF